MRIINRWSCLALTLGLFYCGSASAFEMPKEILGVSVGMSIEELLAARPKIKQPSIDGDIQIDPNKMKSGKMMLLESLPADGDFHSVSYGIDSGKLVTVTLLGSPAKGQESGIRKRVVKDCVQRWGKTFKRRLPRDNARAGKGTPTLTWEIEGTEIALMLPRTRAEDDHQRNRITLYFRPASAIQKKPWKELSVSAAEKKTLFESHDISDK